MNSTKEVPVFKTGVEILRDKGIELPADDSGISVDTLIEAGIPPMVACCGCGMTMSIVSASVRIDENTAVWCVSCVGE
jgi:hypothetical protein